MVACRGQKNLLANDDVDAAMDSHINEAAPRLPSPNINALAARPLTAMHIGAGAVVIDRDAVLAEDLSPMDAYVQPWLQPVLGYPFFSVRELRRAATGRRGSTTLRSAWTAPRPRPRPPHAPCTVQ